MTLAPSFFFFFYLPSPSPPPPPLPLLAPSAPPSSLTPPPPGLHKRLGDHTEVKLLCRAGWTFGRVLFPSMLQCEILFWPTSPNFPLPLPYALTVFRVPFRFSYTFLDDDGMMGESSYLFAFSSSHRNLSLRTYKAIWEGRGSPLSCP